MAQSTNGHSTYNAWRTDPMYSFSEAAQLGHVSTSTVRNWIRGYEGKERQIQPLFNTPASDVPMVSFLQLIEVIVVGKFRKSYRYSLEKIRRAYEYTRTEFSLDYPFAHLKLEPLGGHIVGWMRGEIPGSSLEPPTLQELDEVTTSSLQAFDEPLQWSLPVPILAMLHHQLVYDMQQNLAERWYPLGKTVPIVLDPRLSSGVPTVEGRAVTFQTIHKRFKAQQRINFIAQDLDLEPELVETVLQYAGRLTNP